MSWAWRVLDEFFEQGDEDATKFLGGLLVPISLTKRKDLGRGSLTKLCWLCFFLVWEGGNRKSVYCTFACTPHFHMPKSQVLSFSLTLTGVICCPFCFESILFGQSHFVSSAKSGGPRAAFSFLVEGGTLVFHRLPGRMDTPFCRPGPVSGPPSFLFAAILSLYLDTRMMVAAPDFSQQCWEASNS